ncbi:hypothetical protein CBOM_00614 [Ceraceosorus bombacis]|uniref:Uncharacterized protein n=1 Tax=Ceraceosorus bombacis TaxID=401625 RepID=A0A0P1BB11_9BASI|nr:hypothetical protein CBOM_00614 [Ceraceosorus bombacis]
MSRWLDTFDVDASDVGEVGAPFSDFVVYMVAHSWIEWREWRRFGPSFENGRAAQRDIYLSAQMERYGAPTLTPCGFDQAADVPKG